MYKQEAVPNEALCTHVTSERCTRVLSSAHPHAPKYVVKGDLGGPAPPNSQNLTNRSFRFGFKGCAIPETSFLDRVGGNSQVILP